MTSVWGWCPNNILRNLDTDQKTSTGFKIIVLTTQHLTEFHPLRSEFEINIHETLLLLLLSTMKNGEEK